MKQKRHVFKFRETKKWLADHCDDDDDDDDEKFCGPSDIWQISGNSLIHSTLDLFVCVHKIGAINLVKFSPDRNKP